MCSFFPSDFVGKLLGEVNMRLVEYWFKIFCLALFFMLFLIFLFIFVLVSVAFLYVFSLFLTSLSSLPATSRKAYIQK